MAVTKLDLLSLVDNKRILLCCGSGGVGKTTTSAALAFLAASRGRSVLVLTIDPAKRLAQAMGLDSLSHEPQPIDISALGDVTAGGSLHGMMLDTKRTFDSLVDKYAANNEVKESILNNTYYQHLSNSLAGSREFMAMERVYEISTDYDYDLLVVDTPPSQHALDFIDAPKRMIDLFDGRFLKILLKATQAIGGTGSLLKRWSERPIRFLEKLTGTNVITDLADFFGGFSGLFGGFIERSKRVHLLLQRDECSFLLVCAPERYSLNEAERFFQCLDNEQMPIAGMIVNRVHSAKGLGSITQELGAELLSLNKYGAESQSLTERLIKCSLDQQALAHADSEAIAATEVARQGMPIHKIPHFEYDLHSLEDIQAFANTLT
jgi:anion-transporting  ArsA/GET3 family ATPase